jgi:type II secretory pathway pseudopilin PulG
MKLIRDLNPVFAGIVALVMLPTLVQSQDRASNQAGDVQFELVGQVTNTTTTSIQYGYLTFINGISGVANIFNPGPQNESTALFTFFNDTVNERVTTNGTIRIIDRVGTTTIYLNPSANATFAIPSSFQNGTPIQTSVLRHQVVIDMVTGFFTTTFVNTITSADRFQLDNTSFTLGKVGQTFRTTVFGHLNSPVPSAYIAGYAAGPDLVLP